MKESNTKKMIINTAIDLFGQYGYGNVSMRDIAKQIGIKASSLYNYFDSKESILECAVDDAGRFLSHYAPGADAVVDMLRDQTPYQILERFVSYYEDVDDTYRMAVYRMLYMEMYNSPRILGYVHEYFIQRPVANLQAAMDVMMETGAIPRGDSLAIAHVWSRTSLLYGYIAAHDPTHVSGEEYHTLTDFIIQLAVRGVRAIPVEGIDIGREQGAFPQRLEAPADTKEMILYRALDLFSQYGYAGVTIRQIARAAGIKPSSIYNHFAGKESIMQEIADHFLVRFQRHSIQNAVFDKAVENRDLHTVIRILSQFYAPGEHMEAHKAYRLLFREQYTHAAIGAIFLGTLERDKQVVSEVIDALAAQGVIPPCESRKIAVAYIHTMCSLTIGGTFDGRIVTENEENLRMRTTALLVSAVLGGYGSGNMG